MRFLIWFVSQIDRVAVWLSGGDDFDDIGGI